MNRRNQFFDKIIKNFDKVSDAEKKRIIERLALLSNSQNIIIENLEEGIIAIDEFRRRHNSNRYQRYNSRYK